MTLKDILNKLHHPDIPIIEYRTMNGQLDIFAGMCRYINGELQSIDGDTYSLGDIIERYEFTDNNYLTVWYESEWMRG